MIVAGPFTLPFWLQRESMTLFAEEVILHFRAKDGLAVWQRDPRAGFRTATEFVAREPRYAGMLAVTTADGRRVELYGDGAEPQRNEPPLASST